MVRKMFLILMGALISIISNPISLTASDEATVTGLNPVGIVKTVSLPEDSISDIKDTVESLSSVSAPIASVDKNEDSGPPVEVIVPNNAISIAGHVISIVDVNDTSVDAGDHVNKYGAKLLYGHNTSTVFGDLVNVGVGSVFMMSYGGVTSTFQVAEIQIFEKTSATSLSSNDVNYKMSAIANGKGRYDLVLMTCYGTSYGNGDASHRFVVFANRV